MKKKTKGTKNSIIKRKPKFQDYKKNCLEAVQIEIRINHLVINKTDADSLHKNRIRRK